MIDKITILEIKAERITDAAKWNNVGHELKLLSAARAKLAASTELSAIERELKTVNERLWEIEDEVRKCEAAGEFGDRFVTLARSVYKENDHRAALKRQINDLLGSAIVEEKSYTS